MIVNSKIKQKSKTILVRIRNLVLDFTLYFVTAYMRKYPIHVTWAQGKTPNTLCITWGSKKKLWQTIYNSNYTQKCSKLLQLKMYI